MKSDSVDRLAKQMGTSRDNATIVGCIAFVLMLIALPFSFWLMAEFVRNYWNWFVSPLLNTPELPMRVAYAAAIAQGAFSMFVYKGGKHYMDNASAWLIGRIEMCFVLGIAILIGSWLALNAR